MELTNENITLPRFIVLEKGKCVLVCHPDLNNGNTPALVLSSSQEGAESAIRRLDGDLNIDRLSDADLLCCLEDSVMRRVYHLIIDDGDKVKITSIRLLCEGILSTIPAPIMGELPFRNANERGEVKDMEFLNNARGFLNEILKSCPKEDFAGLA